MNKITKQKAAKIWALANTYHSIDGCFSNTDEEDAVCELAKVFAIKQLSKFGLDPSELMSLEDCISAAKADELSKRLSKKLGVP